MVTNTTEKQVKLTAAVYCRVSTEEQGTNGTSLGSQLQACMARADELGYDVPSRFQFMESYTGLSLNRPVLDVVRDLALRGEFQALIVYSPDRLSRVGEEILTLFKELKLNGVKLVCVNNQWDDSLNGKVIAFMLGWASELEAEQIKERTMRGKKSLAYKGVIPQGTGVGIFGYDWDKNSKTRIINPNEASVVKTIFEKIADGQSRFAIATELNKLSVPTKTNKKWHPLTIQRIVSNRAYIGETYFGVTKFNGRERELQPESSWISMPEATPPIIDEQLFRRARKELEISREVHHGRKQNHYPLTGYIRCGYCGKPLIGTCLSHKYRYYHCRGAYPTTARKAICSARYIRADIAEGFVKNTVGGLLQAPSAVSKDLKKHQALKNRAERTLARQVTDLERKIKKITEQEARLFKLYSLGTIDEQQITKEINGLKQTRERYQAQLANLSGRPADNHGEESAEGEMAEFIKGIVRDSGDETISRATLNALNVNVVATDDYLETKLTIPAGSLKIEKIYKHSYRRKIKKAK